MAILERKHEKIYPYLVLLQVVIILEALLLKDILTAAGFMSAKVIRDFIFMLTGGFYLLLNWKLSSFLCQNKRWSMIILTILTLLLLSIFLVLNPFFPIHDTESERLPALVLIHSVLFFLELTFIMYCIFDIFSHGSTNLNKLWGAACIYLMIGITFGSTYDLICFWKNDALGVRYALGIESYTQCIAFSMTTISGIDPPHSNIHPIIKSISIVEAIWSNLFVMILVGRLLSLPALKENE
jgi:hypothetical protein